MRLLFLFVSCARGQTPTVVSMEVLAMKVPIWDTFPVTPGLIVDASGNTSRFVTSIYEAGVTPNAKIPFDIYITNFFRIKDWCFCLLFHFLQS